MVDGSSLIYEVAALPERVWDAIVNPVKAAGWLSDRPVEVGEWIALPGPIPDLAAEVVAVDAPRRVGFRLHRPGHADAAMTWAIARAAGGSELRVTVAPDVAASEDLVAVLSAAIDRLRASLRGRAPVLIEAAAQSAGPAVAGAAASPPTSSAPAPLPLPLPAPLLTEAPIVFDPIAPARPDRPPRRRRRFGLVPRLILVAVLAAALAALTLSPPSMPWAAAPNESTVEDNRVVGDVSPSTRQSGSAPAAAVAGSAGSAGDATGTATATATAGATTTGQPGASTSGPASIIPSLTVVITVDHNLLNLTVHAKITNPAATAQTWQNVAVELQGTGLVNGLLGVVGSIVLVGDTACVRPTAAASIAAGQTIDVSFTFTGLLPADPTVGLLNQAVCA